MADDSLRALMTAAPRCCTVLMKSPCSHAALSTALGTGFLPESVCTVAKVTSGYCVDEWLPQMVTPSTADGFTFIFIATCDWARLQSSRVSAVKLFLGMLGAVCCRTHAFVLAGLPTTTTLTFFDATSFNKRPCALKIFTFLASRSFRSIPGPRGKAPRPMTTSTLAKATDGSMVTTTAARRSKPQSSSSILTPPSAIWARSMSRRCRMMRLSGPNVRPEQMCGSSE
mmetsp:Transcript_14222/g.20675  ORF Transcript_14222/g.20675 Transcript_14222/m.20675 type:complete len:227 (-) Transcript_14222:61-741(-)